MSDSAKPMTLEARRTACTHARLLEVRFLSYSHLRQYVPDYCDDPPEIFAQRYCILCGEKEKISDDEGQARRQLGASDCVYVVSLPTFEDYESSVAMLDEGIHKRGGMFPEFDALGDWIDEENPRITRGED